VFEPNRGQTDSQVQFLARGPGYQLFLTGNEALFAFRSGAVESPRRQRLSTGIAKALAMPETKSATVRMQILGGRTDLRGVALEPMRGTVNYLRGNDPAKWQTNLPTYGKVKFDDVYPGVDLVYYGNSRRLEYDFIVAPGASPDAITLGFEGADSVKLDAEGDLVLSTAGGPVRFEKPLVYQERGAHREPVAGEYVWKGNRRIGFRVAAYDATRPVIIDPVLSYSSYLGGSAFDTGEDIAVDGSGSAYVTGGTESPDFPTKFPLQPGHAADYVSGDAFVARLTADGRDLVYATYLGGTGTDWGFAIAVDAAGAAYVTGITTSTDFPTRSPLQPTLNSFADVFVAKLASDGSGVIYATYLGGNSDFDGANGIAVDSTGAAYVAGFTQSSDFPTKSPVQSTYSGFQDAFVAKLSPDGTGLVYGTYLGGADGDDAGDIAVDATGAAYITGQTRSPDFPTHLPLQPTLNGTFTTDAFVAKLTAGGALAYSTFLGGSGGEGGFAISIDAAGAAYVTGVTVSQDFPTKSPFQPALIGLVDAFVAKLTPDGSGLVYSTYLGGTGVRTFGGGGVVEFGSGIAVDTAGAAYVTGTTNTPDFIIANPIHPQAAARADSGDSFVAKFTADGTSLVYSVTLRSGYTEPSPSPRTRIALDREGAAYIVGTTFSLNFPTVNALQPTLGGGDPAFADAFVAKLVSASADVPVTNVNSLVQLRENDLTTFFDSARVSPEYPGGTFRIVAGFDNVSGVDICNPFFQIAELSESNRLEAVSIEPAGTQIQGLSGYPVSHAPIVFGVGTTVEFEFVINLLTTDLFRFFVNIWGTPQPAGSPCP
jgi:hypothetical protein